MLCKEDLCKWFKNLSPHQRIDYMCGLLHMCLPLELRFLGSVLEEHGKKNYNFLRDAEIKANNVVDLSKLSVWPEKVLRARISVYLCLLHSSNLSCAQLLFELLETNLGRVFSVGPNTSTEDSEEILMVLTLAINHPAFEFHQKNELYKHYERMESQVRDKLNSKQMPEISVPSEGKNVYIGTPLDIREKVHIRTLTVIEKKRTEKHNEFRIRVTWSNNEAYEIVKTTRELHDFHIKLQRGFPEESELQKREWKVPFIHSNTHHRENSTQILSNYFRLLIRLPKQVIESRHLSEFFIGGTLVPPVLEPMLTLSPHPISHSISPASFPGGDVRNFGRPTYYYPALTRHPNICPHGIIPPQVNSRSHSPLSSSTDNSRSASPTPDLASVTQLLKLLDLEKYSENLSKFTVEQLASLSPEDLGKAGLPKEAQQVLRSKLDHISREKPLSSVNGLVNVCISTGSASPSPTTLICPPHQTQIPLMHNPQMAYPPYPAMYYSMPPTSAQPLEVNSWDISPNGSESSSNPPSPTPHNNPKLKMKGTDSSGSEDNEKVKSNGNEVDKEKYEGKRKVVQHVQIVPQPRSPIHQGINRTEDLKGNVRQPSPHSIHYEPKQDLQPVMSSHNGYQSDPTPSPLMSTGFAPRQPIIGIRPYKHAHPAHTHIGLHKNIINMPQEGHVKPGSQPGPHVMYAYPAHRNDIPSNVASMTINNNIVSNSAFSIAPSDVPRAMPYGPFGIMTRPMVPPGGRPLPNNGNNTATVTVSQVHPSSAPTSHSPGPANVSVKSHNGMPVPNPSMTPPESSLSGRDSPHASIQSGQAAVSTTVTYSTASLLPSQVPNPSNTTPSHPPFSSCDCNCHASASTSFQPPYSAIAHPTYWSVPGPFGQHNGLIAQLPTSMTYGHQLPPGNYPNGFNPELFYNNHPGFHPVHGIYPFYGAMYGNTTYQGQGQSTSSAKQRNMGCYNCGSPSHKAQECKEVSIEAMAGHYHLNYKPKSDSE